MKKIVFYVILALAFPAMAADTPLRVDIDGLKGEIELTGEQRPDMTIAPMHWIKDAEQRSRTLCAVSNENVPTDDWKTYVFSFAPAKSGNLAIQVKGQWAAKPEDYGWLLIDRIVVDGDLLPNGDFTRLEPTGENGKTGIKGFWLGEKARYFDTEGHDGTPAVLVNFKNPLYFIFPVEAGRKYALGTTAKATDTARFMN